MPIAITINGKKILAETITIKEDSVTIDPFQGTQLSGSIKMDYDDFCDFRDKMIKWVEKAADK